MSFTLLDAFRKDPVGLASRTPIISFDKENSAVLKLKGAVADKLYAVKGESRIVAMDLKDVVNAQGISVSEEGVAAKLLADWMPIYYLPWVSNGICRVTLRPRSATRRDGSAKGLVALVPNPKFRVDQTNPASAILDPNDPDIFFTSALNGCTVTVRGSRTEPTVYHGNAKGLADAAGVASPLKYATADKDEASAGALMNAKRQNMEGKFRQLEALDPKQSRAAVPAPSVGTKMLSQGDYQMLVSGGLVAPSQQVAARNLSDAIVTDVGGKLKKLRLAASQGTVFGVRTAGQWTFYYQMLVRYEWWHDTAGMLKKAKWERDNSRPVGYRVVASGEFWPNGAGILVP